MELEEVAAKRISRNAGLKNSENWTECRDTPSCVSNTSKGNS